MTRGRADGADGADAADGAGGADAADAADAAVGVPADGLGRPGGYADLRSYAAIGDGRTIALIALDGRIDWLPLPSLGAPPPFAALLDAEHGGHVALGPIDPFEVERAYVDGTNVLATTYRTASGVVRVTDSLNTGVAGRLPWAELARRVDGVSGSVRLRGVVHPGTCLGSASPWVQRTANGTVLRVGELTMAVPTLLAESVVQDDEQVVAEYVTSPGSRHLLALVATADEPLTLPTAEAVDAGVDRTVANWEAWSREFDWDGAWREQVRRSVLVLKQLVLAPTGAVAAAATVALPESLAGGKNWDYRYAWVRDMAYALTALYRFGLREETHGAISWLLATIRAHGPEPLVLYQLDGELPPGKVERDLPGWRGIGPVQTGNRADGQLQLGAYSDVFTIVRLYVDNGNVLDATSGRMLAEVADKACDRWRSKDAGMWELETERHYTTSKLGCWVALTNAVHLAELGQIPGDPSRWRSEAGRIRAWVDAHAWDEERGTYLMHPGGDELDASILLHAISGFDRGERMSSTLDALRAELGEGPHLFRYTGMRGHEGSFVACSFWMVSALHLVGREDEARALMDELVGRVPNDVGVMAEMVDPADGAFLGNLPQALSHLALVNAAITISSGDAVSV